MSTNMAAVLIETQRKPVVDIWYSLIYVTLVYILWVYMTSLTRRLLNQPTWFPT